MSALTAQALYGHDPTHVDPTATPVPTHMGAPEPTMATQPAEPADVRRPAAALVVLLALAVLLTQVSFRGTVEVGG